MTSIHLLIVEPVTTWGNHINVAKPRDIFRTTTTLTTKLWLAVTICICKSVTGWYGNGVLCLPLLTLSIPFMSFHTETTNEWFVQLIYFLSSSCIHVYKCLPVIAYEHRVMVLAHFQPMTHDDIFFSGFSISSTFVRKREQ